MCVSKLISKLRSLTLFFFTQRRSATKKREEVEACQEQLSMSEVKRHEVELACANLEEKNMAMRAEIEAVRSAALHAREKDEWERQEMSLAQAQATVRQQQERLTEMLRQVCVFVFFLVIFRPQKCILSMCIHVHLCVCAFRRVNTQKNVHSVYVYALTCVCVCIQAGEHAKERAFWQDQRLAFSEKVKEVETLQNEADAGNNSRKSIQ